MVEETQVYQYLSKKEPFAKAADLRIQVKPTDCLVAAHQLPIPEGASICVLNMANQYIVGGDYLSSFAQEESLILRTNLLDSLKKLDGVVEGNACNPFKYDFKSNIGFTTEKQRKGLGEFTALYTQNVTVSTLSLEDESISITPFPVNIISSAAYNLSDEEDKLPPSLYHAGTIFKILNQLRVAKEHQQRNLVLGAFGCGCFGNDPAFIAEVYHAAINEYEFRGCFDTIIFAIKPSNGSDNLVIFQREFSDNTQPKLIRDLLSEIIKDSKDLYKDNMQLIEMLKPFTYIDSANELLFLCKRIITAELKRLENSNSEKCIQKRAFLYALLSDLEKTPDNPQRILTEALKSPECLALQIGTRFFKNVSYHIIDKLKTLLENSPQLNSVQAKLASEWIADYILPKLKEFINNCATTEDKQMASYLIHIAISRSPDLLLDELKSRLYEEQYKPICRSLEEVNGLCLGTATRHRLAASILDLRFCPYPDQKSQAVWLQETAKVLSNYYKQEIILFLQNEFSPYYDHVLFEQALERTDEDSSKSSLRPH